MAQIPLSIVWLNLMTVYCYYCILCFIDAQQQQQQPTNSMMFPFPMNNNYNRNYQTPIPPGQRQFRPYPDNYYNIINNMTDSGHNNNQQRPIWLIRRPLYLFQRFFRNFFHPFVVDDRTIQYTSINNQTKHN
ncbi:hypothetical protein DERP_006970 [Dermatophagoides pteronyssinus]|uniref:Uncharacterized protein n=1 Tax=Dermatophagoides pteronyssinus TaxID=6956 RepID=A0ABQ8JU86_DERPT|nr:hypothetical protein DERP_006970 [Dermatophagoides pteronyssinus]